MAMTIDLNLHPYGYQNEPVRLGKISIHSSIDNKHHEYSIAGVDIRSENFLLTGSIPKEKSGHQNILHTLLNVLKDANIDDLGEGYIFTEVDRDGLAYFQNKS